MLSSTWKRPTEPHFPEVWRKFEKTNKEGKTMKFTVQTASEEYYDEMLELLCKHFMADETHFSAAGCHEDPEFLGCMRELVKRVLFPQKMAVACVLDNDPSGTLAQGRKSQLVGFNMCGVCREGEDLDLSEMLKAESGQKAIGAWEEMKKFLPDVHEKYGFKEYLGTLGLCVAPEFRGMRISEEILLSRIALCKTIGLKATSSYFSSGASQKMALEVGFVEDGQISYKELEKLTGLSYKNDTEFTKVLTYVV